MLLPRRLKKDRGHLAGATKRGLPERSYPGWWRELPDLTPEIEWLIDVFAELETERAVTGFGTGPIPRHRIREWGSQAGMRGPSLENFARLVLTCDRAFLAELGEETEKSGGRK